MYKYPFSTPLRSIEKSNFPLPYLISLYKIPYQYPSHSATLNYRLADRSPMHLNLSQVKKKTKCALLMQIIPKIIGDLLSSPNYSLN